MITAMEALRALGIESKTDKEKPRDLRIIEQRLAQRQPRLTERLAVAYYAFSFSLFLWCWMAALYLCSLFPLLWPVLALCEHPPAPGRGVLCSSGELPDWGRPTRPRLPLCRHRLHLCGPRHQGHRRRLLAHPLAALVPVGGLRRLL